MTPLPDSLLEAVASAAVREGPGETRDKARELMLDVFRVLDKLDKVGVANMMARLMTQGTARKTPQELEEAIQQLGATVNVAAGTEDVRINVTTLARNYDPTLALVEEILLEPRWDAKEFDLIKLHPAIGQHPLDLLEPRSDVAGYGTSRWSRPSRAGSGGSARRRTPSAAPS